MRCTAHARSGKQCGNDAMRGTNVCRMHGGAAPQVRAKAQQRLLEAADSVAARLVELALKADDPRVQLQACRDLLDRVAVSAPKQIEIMPSLELVQDWIAALEADLNADDHADA